MFVCKICKELVKDQYNSSTSRNNQNNERNKPVELFLFLGDLCKNLRPKLPVDYKKIVLK
uniref:Uncharacterized protein n=1 Tax=Rhizophagus irregularis (strain DAOM 181602 / DAOM 197198 / MUCL 43194) TaxID=747089 RepID=U9SIR1_RHIID